MVTATWPQKLKTEIEKSFETVKSHFLFSCVQRKTTHTTTHDHSDIGPTSDAKANKQPVLIIDFVCRGVEIQ
jgi:hypothetical protein